MDIIPAIDLIDGKCVRLTQGDYARKTIYNEDPLEVALAFEGIGIRRLHLVDLDGARTGKMVNQKVLESIASKTRLIIDFGGGIKTDEDINRVFDAGAAMAVAGSIAVKDKGLFYSWIERYGSEKILLAADIKNGSMAIHGWQETTGLSLIDFITEMTTHGVTQLFCTDVSKDGLLQGPSFDLYTEVITRFPGLELVASGGIASSEDLRRLKAIGCKGAIVGKAIYENRISMNELKSFLS